MDEEDRLVQEDEDVGLFHDSDVPPSRKKRRMIGLILMLAFLIVVIAAVSQNKSTIGVDESTGAVDNGDTDEIVEDSGDDADKVYGGTEDQEGGEQKEDVDESTDTDVEDATQPSDNAGEEEEAGGGNDEAEVYNDAAAEEEETPQNQTHVEDSPKATHTIWDLSLDKIGTGKTVIEPSKSPSLVFIKGIKVGGTSVALALNHAALTYQISLAKVPFEKNQAYNFNPNCAILHGTLYFRHGYRNPWQWLCIPNVRHTTLLRDPISQILSFGSYTLNFVKTEYFYHYPMNPCPKRQFIDVMTALTDEQIMTKLNTVKTCNDTPFRRNLTIIYVANQIRALPKNDPGKALRLTAAWIATAPTYSSITAESLIEVLKTKYFLVGVTERINDFLVLIALVNGWDLSKMYYEKCKRSNLDVLKQEFAAYFPELIAKLESSSQPIAKAYEWAAEQFDNHVKTLGGWFKAKVKEYETGLKAFQQSKHPDPNSYQWRPIRYIDGRTDAC